MAMLPFHRYLLVEALTTAKERERDQNHTHTRSLSLFSLSHILLSPQLELEIGDAALVKGRRRDQQRACE